MKDDRREQELAGDLPDDVADAWEAVLIDIHEQQRSEDRDNENEGNQSCPQRKSSASPN